MPNVSPELRTLDEELKSREEKQSDNFDKLIAILLAAFLFRVNLLTEPTLRDLKKIQLDSKALTDLKKLYNNYFSEIEALTEQYTKLELSRLARTNFQKKKIEKISPKQKGYNRRYADKLAKRQVDDLSDLINETITDNYDLGKSGLIKALKEKVKGYQDIRDSVTAETEANRIANQTRLAIFNKSGLVKGVEFTAVLDKRTTTICRSRHGTRLSLKNPALPNYTPPLHARCRSYLVPIEMDSGEGFTPYSEVLRIKNENPAKPVTKIIKVKK